MSSLTTDFQLLAEHSVDVICRIGLDHVLRYASPSCERILGWSPQELVGTTPDAVVLPDDMPVLLAAAQRMHEPDVDNSSSTIRVRCKNGSVVWMEINARLVRNARTGQPEEMVAVMRDVTERKALEQELAKLALTDGLTGLANRRAFDQALEREWLRMLREGSQMSLLLFDLDHFREFNDHYGHQAGDDCLRAVAAVLSFRARSSDVPARYGGEEFALLLPDTGAGGALEVAEQIRLAICRLRIPHSGNSAGGLLVSSSHGVATALALAGGRVSTAEGLLLAADNALYKAKVDGRNRIATSILLASAQRTAA